MTTEAMQGPKLIEETGVIVGWYITAEHTYAYLEVAPGTAAIAIPLSPELQRSNFIGLISLNRRATLSVDASGYAERMVIK